MRKMITEPSPDPLIYIATIPGATIEGLHPSVMLTVSIYGIIFATYYLLWLTIPKND